MCGDWALLLAFGCIYLICGQVFTPRQIPLSLRARIYLPFCLPSDSVFTMLPVSVRKMSGQLCVLLFHQKAKDGLKESVPLQKLGFQDPEEKGGQRPQIKSMILYPYAKPGKRAEFPNSSGKDPSKKMDRRASMDPKNSLYPWKLSIIGVVPLESWRGQLRKPLTGGHDD